MFKSLVEQTPHTRWAFFTNGLSIDEWFIKYFICGRLAPMIQLNSREIQKIAHLMRVTPNCAARQIENWQTIANIISDRVCLQGNVAASIVPMVTNRSEWNGLVHFAVENGVFPLIAELEDSGEAAGAFFAEENPGGMGLYPFRNHIRKRYGIDYKVPVCPATIGGIHINNSNVVTLEPRFGFSCGWFTMGPASVVPVASSDMTYEEICRAVTNYRSERLQYTRERLVELRDSDTTPFGGCGGKEQRILATYLYPPAT